MTTLLDFIPTELTLIIAGFSSLESLRSLRDMDMISESAFQREVFSIFTHTGHLHEALLSQEKYDPQCDYYLLEFLLVCVEGSPDHHTEVPSAIPSMIGRSALLAETLATLRRLCLSTAYVSWYPSIMKRLMLNLPREISSRLLPELVLFLQGEQLDTTTPRPAHFYYTTESLLGATLSSHPLDRSLIDACATSRMLQRAMSACADVGNVYLFTLAVKSHKEKHGLMLAREAEHVIQDTIVQWDRHPATARLLLDCTRLGGNNSTTTLVVSLDAFSSVVKAEYLHDNDKALILQSVIFKLAPSEKGSQRAVEILSYLLQGEGEFFSRTADASLRRVLSRSAFRDVAEKVYSLCSPSQKTAILRGCHTGTFAAIMASHPVTEADAVSLLTTLLDNKSPCKGTGGKLELLFPLLAEEEKGAFSSLLLSRKRAFLPIFQSEVLSRKIGLEYLHEHLPREEKHLSAVLRCEHLDISLSAVWMAERYASMGDRKSLQMMATSGAISADCFRVMDEIAA